MRVAGWGGDGSRGEQKSPVPDTWPTEAGAGGRKASSAATGERAGRGQRQHIARTSRMEPPQPNTQPLRSSQPHDCNARPVEQKQKISLPLIPALALLSSSLRFHPR